MQGLCIAANRVKIIQLELEYSDEKMAELLECTKQVYSMKINGGKPWTLKNLVALHTMSNKSYDWIMGN